jgi:glycosyltransferase involved in cell wall biosynthesis
MGPAALARLTEILRREKPDILHSYRDKANFWARLAGARAKVPITITACRNRMMELRYLLTEKLMSRRSRLILVNSIGVKQELTRYGRVPPDKIRVIYNLLDIEHFRPPTAAERVEARQRWELEPGRRALIVPGRIGLQKHQLGILWAMRRLLRAGKWPSDAVVLFAGRERDRMTSAWVRRLAGEPELAAYTRFLGAVKDIRSLYWAADLLLMPSLFEGLANAALEGCACGLPAILSHAANVDHIIEPGETGWEVPTVRLGPLGRALDQALSTSNDRLLEMGRRSRAHVVARFAPRENHVLDQMVAIYDEVLAGPAPP